MKFHIMTLFPEMIDRVLNESVIGRARKADLFEVDLYNIRDYTQSKQKRVDDAPFGGGGGMIMQCQPIYDCYRAICGDKKEKPHTVYLSPRGKVLTQEKAKDLLKYSELVILCGHYEGVDQRVLDAITDEEISIGDYVLTGGEMPACILVDCVSRMIPGVLAEESSFTEESHYNGLLEHPQYTQPREWNGVSVPDVLLNGNHRAQAQWKRAESIAITKKNRPDMARSPVPDGKRLRSITEEDRALFNEAFETRHTIFEKILRKNPFWNGYVIRFNAKDAGVCLIRHAETAARLQVIIEKIFILPACEKHRLEEKTLRELFSLYEDQRPAFLIKTQDDALKSTLYRLGFQKRTEESWIR